MISDISDYFDKGCGRCPRFATHDCSTRKWASGLSDLRNLCRESGLEETVKWGHPCYVHAQRNIAIIGAFRKDFRLTFCNAALMRDPNGILERRGPNTQHPDIIRFLDSGDVARLGAIITAYLKEAMAYAEAGLKPQKSSSAPDMPTELVAALDADPELSGAFFSLTPGRQRSYMIHLHSAKKAATRQSRIARIRDRILAGKGVTER